MCGVLTPTLVYGLGAFGNIWSCFEVAESFSSFMIVPARYAACRGEPETKWTLRLCRHTKLLSLFLLHVICRGRRGTWDHANNQIWRQQLTPCWRNNQKLWIPIWRKMAITYISLGNRFLHINTSMGKLFGKKSILTNNSIWTFVAEVMQLLPSRRYLWFFSSPSELSLTLIKEFLQQSDSWIHSLVPTK